MAEMSFDERVAYLREHLHYEVIMLRHAYSRMGTSDGLDFNAFLEAFAVHCRVLIEFLTKKHAIKVERCQS